jgi:chorismate dehydratase
MGRICYINVLPIYHAMDLGRVENGFQQTLGTPAELNAALFAGRLDVSAISSYEYGRHFREYLLLPELSISTQGDAGSVLFFSRLPFNRLESQDVLLSAGSATSQALLKVILAEQYGCRPSYRVGPVGDGFDPDCAALLAIGDEALRLHAASAAPYVMDLGRAWHDLTGLPFVFGVWAVRRDFCRREPETARALHRSLVEAKNLGLAAMPEICRRAADAVPMTQQELLQYFGRLNYDLDDTQQEGLTAFFTALHRLGELPEMPALDFLES